MNVGALSVILSLVPNKSSWKQGHDRINHFRRVALGVGAVLGGGFLLKGLLGFNRGVEDAKNQIASMLALGGQTTLVSQLGRADKLYDMLRTKAASLPGETQDYVNMLGLLAQPMARAKLGLEDMRDITAGSFVMAKGMGISWQEAARDLRDYINQGKVSARDKFLLGMLQGSGVDVNNLDKARAQSQALGVEGRANLIKKQSTGPLAQEVAARLGSSFGGRLETVIDTVKQIGGKIGEALFQAVGGSLTKIAAWLTDNKDAIAAWATNVGAYVGKAFELFQTGVLWLIDHQSVFEGFLLVLASGFAIMAFNAVIAWAAVAWPLFAGAALYVLLRELRLSLEGIVIVFGAIGVAALAAWLGVLGPIVLVLILVAAIVAAFYFAGDEIMGVLNAIADRIMWVIDKAKELFDTIFGGSVADVAMSVAMGNDPITGKPLPPQRNLDPWEAGAAAASGQANVTTGPTTINISTTDVAGAKEAFKGAGSDLADAYMRAAARAGKK